jgi:hypothetical protein
MGQYPGLRKRCDSIKVGGVDKAVSRAEACSSFVGQGMFVLGVDVTKSRTEECSSILGKEIDNLF